MTGGRASQGITDLPKARLVSNAFASRAGALAAHVSLPLLVGGATYALWRPHIALMRWLHADHALPRIAWSPPRWLLDHLADALWGYAVGAFVCLVWSGAPSSARRRAWIAVGAAVVVGFELAQAAGLVAGTFDVVDLLASSVAFFAAVAIASRRRLPA